MADKDKLYQERIMDHFKHPRNQSAVDDAACLAEEFNPTCGDVVRVTFQQEQDLLQDLRYEVKGCAITVASASIMSETLNGFSPDKARQLIDTVLEQLNGPDADPVFEDIDLQALLTVKNFPMRLKCATLPWVAMKRALVGN